ncbi:sigma-70 family RNA polymerase sigma factor [Aureispira anguillae]|uniref:Sigma-70 family RNA polymerase sigma factor n=1 Tax=Aureispira anguillae TaxID=2864201 RepID=A0A915YB68_9BACT|nr:sigma-70 family RNA polymerase sigma factor [Aureispira anguillae]BDS09857.1 sigma-70 family RNA polymerase sigma factor [Aureispira anguillae]
MRFEQIWEQYHQLLLNFIKTKVNSDALAEDLLQEVAIKLHRSLNRETTIKNYKTWLFQVSRNSIADYYRKHKKATELPAMNTIEEEASACICDLSGFVIQHYLPKEYAEPLYLSDIEQKPQKEIAQFLNLSLTATKSRIQRGRKKLKSLVEDCITIFYNDRGEITDYHLKKNCELPPELLLEIKKINLVL